MTIGGFRELSLIDYPGYMSTVIFVQGCNFRCRYCHNRHLVYPELFGASFTSDTILQKLRDKPLLTEAFVVTGGEPAIFKDLPEFLKSLRSFNKRIKLDTNGSNPGMLKTVLTEGLADFIAMDIKSPFGKYREITGVQTDQEKIAESISIIQSSGIDHHFRTTYVNNLLSESDLLEIKMMCGSSRWVLNNYRTPGKVSVPGTVFEEFPEVSDNKFSSLKEHLFQQYTTTG
ncbi:MAG: anaerobic ribonucleoside-triphosphate reductase activating protein [Bacteroidota bacterium]